MVQRCASMSALAAACLAVLCSTSSALATHPRPWRRHAAAHAHRCPPTRSAPTSKHHARGAAQLWDCDQAGDAVGDADDDRARGLASGSLRLDVFCNNDAGATLHRGGGRPARRQGQYSARPTFAVPWEECPAAPHRARTTPASCWLGCRIRLTDQATPGPCDTGAGLRRACRPHAGHHLLGAGAVHRQRRRRRVRLLPEHDVRRRSSRTACGSSRTGRRDPDRRGAGLGT